MHRAARGRQERKACSNRTNSGDSSRLAQNSKDAPELSLWSELITIGAYQV